MARKRYYQRLYLPARGGREFVLDLIKRLPIDRSFDIEVTDHQDKRTVEQNKLAQKICREIARQVVLEGKRSPQKAWWYWLKRDHWGPEFQILPDGTAVEVEPPSAGRSKEEFSEFVEYLFAKAAELGVVLEEEGSVG